MLNVLNMLPAAIATAEESRYNLDVIRVTPECTEATDGHQAMRVTTPSMKADDFVEIPGLTITDNFEPFLLDADFAQHLAKMVGRKKTIFPATECIGVGASADGQSVAFGLCVDKDLGKRQRFDTHKMQGQFPNVDLVIPKPHEQPTQVVYLNGAMLGNLLLLLSRVAPDDKSVELRFYAKGDGSHLLAFEVANENTGQVATAVMMGMRPPKNARKYGQPASQEGQEASQEGQEGQEASTGQPASQEGQPGQENQPTKKRKTSKEGGKA